MNLRIQITIQDNAGHTEVHPVDVNVEMPENGPMIIDHVEQEILRVNRDVILATISAYLEELSKKKPELREALMAEWSRQMSTLMPWTEKWAGLPSGPTPSSTRPARRGTRPRKSSRP